MPRRLDLLLLGTLLLGAGFVSGQDDDDDKNDDQNDNSDDQDNNQDGDESYTNSTSPTAFPTSDGTPSPTQPMHTCDFVRLSVNETGEDPMMRAPGTCWNNRETHSSDYFQCNDDGTLSYFHYDKVNCLPENEDYNATSIDTFFPPDSDINGEKTLDGFLCGLSDCWVEVTYFNVTGDDCPITYSMDRASYTLGSCSYNQEIKQNTLWECCDGGGVQVSVFAGDDDTCAQDPEYVEIFEADDSDESGATRSCVDFSKANSDGDSDIEWHCNGNTVTCGGDSMTESSDEPSASTTQIALVAIFTVLALAGCIYCVYSGHMRYAGKAADAEDGGLLAEKQPNYNSDGIKA